MHDRARSTQRAVPQEVPLSGGLLFRTTYFWSLVARRISIQNFCLGRSLYHAVSSPPHDNVPPERISYSGSISAPEGFLIKGSPSFSVQYFCGVSFSGGSPNICLRWSPYQEVTLFAHVSLWFCCSWVRPAGGGEETACDDTADGLGLPVGLEHGPVDASDASKGVVLVSLVHPRRVRPERFACCGRFA